MRVNDLEPMLAKDFPSHPNPDWQFYWDLLFNWLTSPKIPRCWFRPMVKSTNATSSDYPSGFLSTALVYLSLPNPPSLCLSFSPFCSIPSMFYLLWFPLNTQLIWWPLIIDCNKLISNTLLFHFEVAHNITHWAHSLVKKKMKRCEYGPWPVPTSKESSLPSNMWRPLLDLVTNTRQGLKWLTLTNALAYYSIHNKLRP